jgi:pimeloyl-ACP methyl ester carboxylesterase
MAVCKINGADIYYRVFGKDQPGKAPVPIHGSTVTGQQDWGRSSAAAGNPVIVPDRRGHGKAATREFLFVQEMAAICRR